MTWTNPLLHILVDIEPGLNLAAFLAIFLTGLSKRFPAMTAYLAMRCSTDAFLFFVLKENHLFTVSVRTQTITYVYGYWICYTLVAIAIFFALQEVFKAVMEPVPGLQRLGLVVFRWVSIASAIILVAMASPARAFAANNEMIYASLIGAQIMRCVSILEICLLAYLALSVHSLGRSFSGRVFGIGLGFGLEASAELICSLFIIKDHSIWSVGNLVIECASIAALLTWTVYFLLPEPVEETLPITLPVTSPLLRWNDIASALGQRPAHVALGSASSAFFLQDVEQVVDKFLTKTP